MQLEPGRRQLTAHLKLEAMAPGVPKEGLKTTLQQSRKAAAMATPPRRSG